MKQILTLLSLLFLLKPTFGQKHFDIPETQVIKSFVEKLPEKLEKLELNNLRTSTDSLNIRIWQSNKVFTLNHNDSTSSEYKIHTKNDELVFRSFNFSRNISQDIMDSLLGAKIMDLKNDNYRGIDGSFIFIEISTRNKYKIVSFWSPKPERSNDNKTVVQMVDMLNVATDSKNLQNEFLNSLPSGNYSWGMTGIRIDKFLDKSITKTNFYSQTEEKIKAELNIDETTNQWNYPLIVVNGKYAKIADLNKYRDKDVSKLEILKPDNKMIALYGASGSNGVVILETK